MTAIHSVIDADWIKSLCDTENAAYAEKVINMLQRHDDVLYDYIDDAILEMIDREGD